MKPNLIVIVGPTASGKSELAVRLAQKLNGEIISADSRQVYRGLNIGTGKVPGKWRRGSFKRRSPLKRTETFFYKNVPHHCIDFVSPKKTYTAAEFKKCAEEAIQDNTNRGKIPILAGGSAFWIDTVVYGLNLPPVPPDSELRQKLAKKSSPELLRLLQKIDPERARSVEPQNPRRLIRAIEIARALGKVPKLKKRSPYRILWIGLKPSYETGSHKIKLRVKKMIKQGLVGETKNLLRKGVSKKRLREFGFEYTAALDYLEGKLTRRELEALLVARTLRYAKKQIGWWKRNPEIRWFKTLEKAASSPGSF